jgi:hypothetical protein
MIQLNFAQIEDAKHSIRNFCAAVKYSKENKHVEIFVIDAADKIKSYITKLTSQSELYQQLQSKSIIQKSTFK